jgi:hypothetical protein
LISRNWNVSTYLRPTNPGTLAADRTEPGAELSETNTDMTPETCVAARSLGIKKGVLMAKHKLLEWEGICMPNLAPLTDFLTEQNDDVEYSY